MKKLFIILVLYPLISFADTDKENYYYKFWQKFDADSFSAMNEIPPKFDATGKHIEEHPLFSDRAIAIKT